MTDDQEQEPYVEPSYLTRAEIEDKISHGRHEQLFFPGAQVALENLALMPWSTYGWVPWDVYDYTGVDFTEVSLREATIVLARLNHALFLIKLTLPELMPHRLIWWLHPSIKPFLLMPTSMMQICNMPGFGMRR